MIDFILTHYKQDLIAMSFTYIGIASIIFMFLPKNNILVRLFKEFASIFKTLFKK
jgi:hypothetical protein